MLVLLSNINEPYRKYKAHEILVLVVPSSNEGSCEPFVNAKTSQCNYGSYTQSMNNDEDPLKK